jgi:hypothetical protein
MNDFFTWGMLATYAGATLATGVITQFIKGLFQNINTKLIAYIVSVVVLILATAFTGGLSAESVILCIINAAVVSLAANGAYDAITKK